MLKENFLTEVAVKIKTKTFVTEKIIAVTIIVSSFFSLVMLGAYITAPLWQKQVVATTQQQNPATDQQMKIVANPVNNDVQLQLISSVIQEPYQAADEIFYHPGWPVTIPIHVGPNIFWPGIVSPVVEDLNNDRQKELIITVQGSATPPVETPANLFIYNERGQIINEWDSLDYHFSPFSLPSVVDINNDGNKEIITLAFSLSEYSWGILIFDNQAHIINSWFNNYFLNESSFAVYQIEDINDDNFKEIIFFGVSNGNNSLIVLDNNGNFIPGFPVFFPNNNPSPAPVIANINNDHYKEIITTTHYYNQGVLPDIIKAYNYQGQVLWEQTFDGQINQGLIAGDVNRDGFDEIIFNTDKGLFILNSDGSYVTSYDLPSGYVHTAPAIGNLDSDSDLEIVFGHLQTIYAINYTGEEIFNVDFGDIVSLGVPLIADINNDRSPEVIFGQYNTIKAWDNQGNLLDDFPLNIPNQALYIIPTIKDIDNNGDLELIASSSSYYYPNTTPMIYVWDLNGQATQQSHEWPMFAHDVRHTGNYRSSQ